MEELLVKINYLIREKLWCSIRSLCDDVSALSLKTNVIAIYRNLKKVQTQSSFSGSLSASLMKEMSTRPSEN